MERYRAAHQPKDLVCPPPVADWYRERVSPVTLGSSPSINLHEPNTFQTAEAGEGGHQPVQLYSAPEETTHQSKSLPSTSAQILTKIRAPHDAQLKYLGRMFKRLRQSTTTEEASDTIEADNSDLQLTTYTTAFGTFSFSELCDRSRKYAAFVLHHRFYMHPDDIEDGLQAGAIRLWKRLQQEPTGLQDKTMSWIGMHVVYAALHATRSDWKQRQKTQTEGGWGSTSGQGTHSHEARQADKRTDIHQAIAAVAQRILTEEKGKRQNQDLWALYGLTMLQVGAGELSRLFGVREQSMGKAYERVRHRLQAALPNYAPRAATRPFRRHGPEALPKPDMPAIRQGNEAVSEAVLGAVQERIESLKADTRSQDEVALAGIRQGIPSTTQAKQHGIPQWTMQRAYQRVHLLIAAERDPTVRVPRPERRVKPVFTLTAASAAAVEQLAWELLEQPKSYEKLVALHAHIGNLGISTTAKHFNIPTSTLRYYSQQIGRRLQTPTHPARESRVVPKGTDDPHSSAVTLYSWQSAAD